jgi:hypothetical protein
MENLHDNLVVAITSKKKTLTYRSYSRTNAIELAEELDRQGFYVTLDKEVTYVIIIDLEYDKLPNEYQMYMEK